MANEYLKRTPTSTGNRKVWTWSGWVKQQGAGAFFSINGASNYDVMSIASSLDSTGDLAFSHGVGGSNQFRVSTSNLFRDQSGWFHFLVSVDTTKSTSTDRCKLYVNGILQNNFNSSTFSSINYDLLANLSGKVNYIGRSETASGGAGAYLESEIKDVFMVDGQALTPDVFGFNKTGKGYISAGSTQATDFRPGQWVPKPPRIIKADINSRGGFGVNGFYLPMNSSNNFGADFHCTPNSILKLQENLPQPKCRIDGVGDYTGALRDDPFKQYLVLALPFVSGGLQNGFGDYSHIIKGSGSPCTLTGGNQGTPIISTNQSTFYGSSLYFDGNDTLNVETNNSNYLGQDFTIEFWVWHDAAYPINQMAFNTTPHTSFGISLNRDGSGQTALFIGNGSYWELTDFRSGGRLYSQQWNHVVVERYNNTITIYHNGVGQGSFKAGETVVTNSGTFTGVMPTGYTSLFRYGTYENNAGEPIVGYIQDYRVYSGVAKYKGGFDVPKPYTPVGIATWRAVPDTTANNFATWNALQSSIPLTDGNLTCTGSGSNQETYSTVGITTGKWYVEARTNVGTHNHFGLRANSTAVYDSSYRLIARDDGNVYGDTSEGLIASLSDNYNQAGDIVAMAIDGDNGQVTYYINGVNVGGPYSIYQYSSAPTPYKVYNLVNSGNSLTVNFGQNPTFSGNTTAGTYTDSNGKGLFKYQPPSGFLALCEDNLPTPAIKNPGEHFKTVLWTGDDNNGRSITGVGFKPDLVWFKNRSAAYYHHLYDSVRGANRALYSNGTDAEFLDNDALLSFDSDGFSIGGEDPINRTGDSIVAWCWKAGGEAVTNTDGTITSQVSVNQDAGFSIVSWTGNGTSGATVGHGLGKRPKMIISKRRDTSQGWYIWTDMTTNVTANNGLSFDTNGVSAYNFGNFTSLNNFTMTLTQGGSGIVNVNTSSSPYIAYCWTEIDGFSKFGSYVGNGSVDGPFVYCGFKPAFILIKSSSASYNWYIIDNARSSTNPANSTLAPNTENIEDNGWNGVCDLLSNGFKIRESNAAVNASGETYIFAAFAESAFSYSNAK